MILILDESQAKFTPMQPHKDEYAGLPLALSMPDGSVLAQSDLLLAPLQYVSFKVDGSIAKVEASRATESDTNTVWPLPLNLILNSYLQIPEAKKEMVLAVADTETSYNNN